MPMLLERHRQPEIMDQSDLSPARHIQALQGLARINFLSASAGILWPELARLARSMAPRVPRILDVATGGGDVPLRLGRRARRAGLRFEIEGCDISPVAVEYARNQAARAGVPVRFFEQDALAGPPLGDYDAVTCSLFLHHLDEGSAVTLLRRMADATSRLVLVNDLQRSRTGLLLAHVAGHLLTTSDVVHVDGPRSVEAAFTLAEARVLAQRAGLAGARVRWRWPFRWLLLWRRNPMQNAECRMQN
jgi:SAM-dependent methyltransferase